ncbi:MAG: hypothetical protein HZA62_08240 [Rhodocyclales bacterium]|nr:hypothetical protein [Rhodocyclales bacterium]
MTPEREIFQRSRRRLNILGASIFFALTLVFGSIYLRDSLIKSLATSQGLLGARTATLNLKQGDLSSIRTHIARYRELRQQGLVGNAERESWVEQLVATRSELGVAEMLNYVLKPPRSVAEDGSGELAAASSAANPDAQGADSAMYHDLDFEIRGSHEGELLALLNEYRSKVKGRFRMQSCRLGSPGSNGLVAQCTLRFFNQPEPAKNK